MENLKIKIAMFGSKLTSMPHIEVELVKDSTQHGIEASKTIDIRQTVVNQWT
ncbi:hypothetical protein [Acinetobacter courvalinii]|uniref:hypothetical protein n=1 Tax=Acinetobacter courvalinii TaxID=280147 RepID=UPI0021D1D7E6|nr:hypothetical protein [Acinetobacter courvalinii]MCU4641137.1 hypothetical protein [Acinetobacter courvalinii]